MTRENDLLDVEQTIIKETNSTVVFGPFKNMLIDANVFSWGGGRDISRKLLGIYEQELHPLINYLIHIKPKRIINVGHAEGYYAIGLAQKLPNAKVIAFDISEKAKEAIKRNMELNKVQLLVADNIPEIEKGDIWIVDIEGGEIELITTKDWMGVSLLIELHEWKNRNMLSQFIEIFKNSHNIKIINSGPRNPNQFNFLSMFSDDIRWRIMSENRPERMRWMWVTPKNKMPD